MYLYYIVLFIVTVPGLLLQKRTDRGYKDLYCLYVFAVLWTISSFRGYSVGGDLLNYLPLFKEISNHSFYHILNSYDKFGYIFKLYIKVWSYISHDPTFFLSVISLLNIGIVCWFINKRSRILWFSFFLYITLGYYTNTFNSIRSSMALGLGIIGVDALMDKKNLKSFIWFLLAFEIHKTIIPIFTLLLIKDKRYKLPLMITSTIGCFILSNIFGSSMLAKLILLYDSAYAMQTDFGGRGYNLLIIDAIMTFGCYFLIKNRNTTQDRMLINILWLATCLQCMAPIFSIATRISYFFTFYSIILLPNAIYNAFSNKSKRFVLALSSVLCIIYFKLTIMTPVGFSTTNSQATIPYYFYWEKKNENFII